jgi:hypothetical protein
MVEFESEQSLVNALAEYVNAQQPNEKEVRTAVRQMHPALQRYLFDSLLQPIVVGIANSYADKRNQRVVNESTHLAHHQGWAYALDGNESTESPPDGGHYIVGINDLFRVPKRDCDSKEEAELQVAKRVGTGEYEVFDTEVVDIEPGDQQSGDGQMAADNSCEK